MQYTGSIIENVFCNAQKLRNKRLDWSRLKQPSEYRILNRCKVLNTAVGYEYNQRMKDKKNFPPKISSSLKSFKTEAASVFKNELHGE